MKKTAPNYPAAPNYPKANKADPKAPAEKAMPAVDEREIARQEHSNHFTNRADGKGK